MAIVVVAVLQLNQQWAADGSIEDGEGKLKARN
jgi:hypothetical protein